MKLKKRNKQKVVNTYKVGRYYLCIDNIENTAIFWYHYNPFPQSREIRDEELVSLKETLLNGEEVIDDKLFIKTAFEYITRRID